MGRLEGTKETQINTQTNHSNKGERKGGALQRHYSEEVKSVLAPNGNEEERKVRNGVNFQKCQMNRIVEAYRSRKQVEFEALSPYLSEYNMATGEVWPDKLTKGDVIGLAIAKLLREKFRRARQVSLYDEYNSAMPDSENDYGAPTKQKIEAGEKKEAPQLVFPDETKKAFRESVEELMRIGGAIRENDKEGKDYLFVSESSKVVAAEKLVKQLEAKGKIERDGQKIYFVSDEVENPEYKKIQLRTANGRWTCEALDASSYLNKRNLKITHLVVLPNHFMEQQDKVWEILRTLGIESTSYHNIFYDENVDPGTIVDTICEEIETYEKGDKSLIPPFAGSGLCPEPLVSGF